VVVRVAVQCSHVATGALVALRVGLGLHAGCVRSRRGAPTWCGCMPPAWLSALSPACMGRRETEREGGRSRRQAGVRGEIPRPSCLSRAQVGCACSRGYKRPRGREGAASRERRPVLLHAANPL
jgi:hypothetical protein